MAESGIFMFSNPTSSSHFGVAGAVKPDKKVNQSVNKSSNQPINESISQSINQTLPYQGQTILVTPSLTCSLVANNSLNFA